MAFSDRSFDYSSRQLIPCVVIDGPPTEKTDGAIGALCIEKKSGNLYKCVSANYRNNMFTWKIVGEVSNDEIRQSVSDYLAQHPVSGGGITSAAAALLITILQNAVFTTNQTGNIVALQQALASGGSSGGDSGGDTPDVPDIPDTPDEPDEPMVTDDITVTDGVMTIVTIGSEITVSGSVMTIA